MVDAYVLFVMCVVDASWGSVSKEMQIVCVDVVCGCVIVGVQFFFQFFYDFYTYVMASSFVAVVIFSLTMLMLLVSFSSAFSADV